MARSAARPAQRVRDGRTIDIGIAPILREQVLDDVVARALLKRGSWSPAIDTRVRTRDQEHEAFSGVRCPLCDWQPSPWSVWACESEGTPEPYFGGCGTIWNTFITRGKCPGCEHRWRWTSCHQCLEWSLHEDWYVVETS